MENTKIEWADNTFNSWIGCAKVGPGCENCYAEAMQDQRYGNVKWGPGQPRKRTSEAAWKKPLSWSREATKNGTRPFVFCASLADVFDNEVDPAWRADLFSLISKTPNLVWLLLTKRIGNVLKMAPELPRNVAIGASIVNQEEYDRDIDKLLAVKTELDPLFTFGSFEPLLGPVQMDERAPDWIIVGGESGRNARPMDLDWARSLRQQSADFGRVFNFKQVGDAGGGGHQLDGETYFDRPAIAPGVVSSARRKTLMLPVEMVVTGDRVRKVKPKSVEELSRSLGEFGLMQPIHIRHTKVSIGGKPAKRVPLLVAGAHRLEAAKLLGWPQIECIEVDGDDVTARMWEISENLFRKELTKAQRDQCVRDYAALVEEERRQSGHDVPFESSRADGRGHRKKGVSAEIAEKLGMSKRTVDRARAGSDASQSNPKDQTVAEEYRGLKALQKSWLSAAPVEQTKFLAWLESEQSVDLAAHSLVEDAA